MEIFFVIASIIIVVGLVVFVLIKGGVFSKTNEKIGKRGENLVSKFLRRIPKSIVFNDVILADNKTKKSSQMDHIVIRPNGVFVIETKNYAGSVYGDDTQHEWTQVLAHGEIKNRFYNPVKQNATHIYFLEKALKQRDIFISVIIFPRAELHVQTVAHICNGQNALLQTLNSNTGIRLSAGQRHDIAARLSEIKNNTRITKNKHIKNIRKTQRDIANNICPRCGKPLVFRNGKNGSFYGCSGYPDCRFTKKESEH